MPAAPPSALAGAVIVVDPGHNGGNASHGRDIARTVDAGGFEKACNTAGAATAAGYSEAAFAWDVAVRVRALLEAAGATVILTRSDNEGVGPCIDQRGRTAAGVRGLATAVAPCRRITARIWVPRHRSSGASRVDGEHCSSVRGARPHASGRARERRLLPANYIGSDGVDVRGDLGTLNWAGTPAVIVECGNMLNRDDAAVMSSEDGRQRIADALVAGVAAYLG